MWSCTAAQAQALKPSDVTDLMCTDSEIKTPQGLKTLPTQYVDSQRHGCVLYVIGSHENLVTDTQFASIDRCTTSNIVFSRYKPVLTLKP